MPPDPLILQGGDGLVLLDRGVLVALRRFTLEPERHREAGGVLVGVYRGTHLEILQHTEPLSRDRRYWDRFDRRDHGHTRAVRAAWLSSGRTMTYVGEWHSHPIGDAAPSSIDRQTWAKVMRRAPGQSLFFIIVAPDRTWFGLGADGVLSAVHPLAEAETALA